ncbi:uncharacterized protein LAESUDRAFT_403258 [Laetiporus sulphureus 93-53]|uniref:Uncharacterized protein n=1 Tax=Laetiporus sulphureus 93-53 TaxID=1314785 RepID=A0A165CCK2_9APHY|nr:uncharacterized protein LAESUDRAFT_403258 [Laetiporus sulphureus 93-53]KZT02566.1 hypothetical protein LAESUDRAFT_403258 [Laetiporus sulphureus 93-53]
MHCSTSRCTWHSLTHPCLLLRCSIHAILVKLYASYLRSAPPAKARWSSKDSCHGAFSLHSHGKPPSPLFLKMGSSNASPTMFHQRTQIFFRHLLYRRCPNLLSASLCPGCQRHSELRTCSSTSIMLDFFLYCSTRPSSGLQLLKPSSAYHWHTRVTETETRIDQRSAIGCDRTIRASQFSRRQSVG